MKRQIRYRKVLRKAAMILVLFACIFIGSMNVNITQAAARKVDFKQYKIDYDMKAARKLAQKLGLKKKSNNAYKIYYSGKKVIIAENPSSVSWPKKYTYVKNGGNKKFTFYGVKIGDKKAVVMKKLKKAGLYTYNGGKTYGVDYAGFRLKYKNGKLKSWIYQLYPTS